MIKELKIKEIELTVKKRILFYVYNGDGEQAAIFLKGNKESVELDILDFLFESLEYIKDGDSWKSHITLAHVFTGVRNKKLAGKKINLYSKTNLLADKFKQFFGRE
jgi:hypothetical protein